MMRLKILIKPFNSVFINSIMNKQIISEVSRISTLMGVKPLITEQAVPRFIKSLLNLSDDVVKKFYKTGDNVSDDLLRKVRNGESLTDDAIELLLRNIDFQNLSKIIIDGKWLGSNFDNYVDSIVDNINKNPENTKNILNKFNNFFDNIPFLDDAPEELITALKSEVRGRIISRTSKIVDSSANVLSSGQRKYINSTVKLHHLKIYRLIRDLFKDNITIANEIRELANGYAKGGSQYSQAYAIKIGEKLNVLSSKSKGLNNDIWDLIKKDIPKDLRKKLQLLDSTKRWAEIREVLNDDESIGKTISTGYQKFKDTLPFKFRKGFPQIWFKKISAEDSTKLVNFILTGQMQTTRELYERLIKMGYAKGTAITYLKAVAPTLLIPSTIALGKTFIGPLGKQIEDSINNIGTFFDKDWDYNITNWEPETEEGKLNMLNTITKSFKSLWGDESEFFQYQWNDFMPGFNTYVLDLVDWWFTIGYKGDSEPPQPVTSEPNKTSTPTIEDFKVFIKEKWASAYNTIDEFAKDKNIYTVTSGNLIYSYIYNGTTFEQKIEPDVPEVTEK